MATPTAVELRSEARTSDHTRRLFVAWQHPETRTITPVGELHETDGEQERSYLFRYLSTVGAVKDFHPFVGFPDTSAEYHSDELFPFFANRIMPRSRADFADWVAMFQLPVDADPFEILTRSAARRATDTVEVFPEPSVSDATACTTFLVRGVRHIPHAIDAIDVLDPGEKLLILHDAQNDHDLLALALRTEGQQLIGYIPAYLCPLIHRSSAKSGWVGIDVTVAHRGDRGGPPHLNLLCSLSMPWPFVESPGDLIEAG
jgi:hypothetical protein